MTEYAEADAQHKFANVRVVEDADALSAYSVIVADDTTVMVAAVAAKAIEVWGVQFTLNTAAGSLILKSAATAKWGLDAAITGGAGVAPGSKPLFVCAVAEALNAVVVGGPGKCNVQYRLR